MTNQREVARLELARAVVALATVGLALYVQDHGFRSVVDGGIAKVRAWMSPPVPTDPLAARVAAELPGILEDAERITKGGPADGA